MGEFVTAFAEKLGQKGVHTNLLTIVMVVIACVWINNRVGRWERTLNSVSGDCWRIADQVEWTHRYNESHRTNDMPDPTEIVKARVALRTARQSQQADQE